MSGLMAYSGLVTKIRAMRSHLLTEEQFREFLESPNVNAAVSYLKQIPSYQDVLGNRADHEMHREEIEQVLRNSVYHDYSKIYSFAGPKQRQFLELYYMRYESYLMRICLTDIFDGREHTLDLSAFEDFFNKHSKKMQLHTLSHCASLEEFVSNLKGTGYYEPFQTLLESTTPNLFDCEIILDNYIFSTFWKNKDKIVSKKEAKDLTNILGSKFDMLNLLWIYRAKKYYSMSSAAIYALLVPVNHHLSTEQIQEMVEAPSLQAFEALVEQSYYIKHYKASNDKSLETLYSEIQKSILRGASRKNPYSISTIYSYLYQKEHEIDRLIIALECIRYHIPIDEALGLIACR